MTIVDMSDRKQKILRAIVETYIDTAEPVGSKTITQNHNLGLSSATVRNEMADLEALGYLEQPHTSAGRIPSAQGYRFYVDELMNRYRLTLEETDSINQALKVKMSELDHIVTTAGKMISKITQYPSYIIAPTSVAKNTVKKYELLPVDEKSFAIIIVTENNAVKNKLIHLPFKQRNDELHRVTEVLNSMFTGISADEMTDDLINSVDLSGTASTLMTLALEFAYDTLGTSFQQEIVLSGASQILSHPEYKDVNKARNLLTYLSDGDAASKLTVPSKDDGVQILIGPENLAEEMKDASVVAASYSIGDGMRGMIGVVGPTRMDYAKVTAKLAYLADGLKQLFESGTQSPSDMT